MADPIDLSEHVLHLAGSAAAGEPPTPDELELAESLRRERYDDRAWHAGPWHDVTPERVTSVLGGDAR